jgi:cyanophycin synthetase
MWFLVFAKEYSKRIIVEKISVFDRILVIDNKLVAARVPAHVVGDGTATIQELITTTNLDPEEGMVMKMY